MLKFAFQLKDQYGNHWTETVTVDGLRTKSDAELYVVKWVTCMNATKPMNDGPVTAYGNVRLLKLDLEKCVHHQWTLTNQEPDRAGLMRYHCRRCAATERREVSGARHETKLKKRV